MISTALPVASSITARRMPSGPVPGPKLNFPPRSATWAVNASKSLVPTAICGAKGESSGWKSGFSTTWSSDLQATIDEEHFTDDETVIEGRLCGKHAKEFMGFAPTDRDVELPFVAFYRFDDNGKLTSERVVMNLGPLNV